MESRTLDFLNNILLIQHSGLLSVYLASDARFGEKYFRGWHGGLMILSTRWESQMSVYKLRWVFGSDYE